MTKDKILKLAFACALVGTAAVAQAVVKTAALQGDPTPVTGTYSGRFKNPAVSDAVGERVTVYNRTKGGNREKCIFKLDPDLGDSDAACLNHPSPDGRLFKKFGDPVINLAGDVAFSSLVSFGLSGVYRDNFTVVALLGDPVPAPGPGLLQSLTAAQITSLGDVVFRSTISGGTVDEGIFRCPGGVDCSANPGTLETLVLINDAVPDRLGRELCSFTTPPAASLFGIAFGATTKLDCTDGGEAELVGTFRKPYAGPIVTVALEGEAAEPFPVPAGTTYDAMRGVTVAISDLGHVAFLATTQGITGPPTTTSSTTTSTTSTTTTTVIGTTTTTTSSSTTTTLPPSEPLGPSTLYICDPATCPAAPAVAAVSQGQVDDAGNAFSSFSAPGVSNAGDIAFTARLRGGPNGSASGAYIRRSTADIETLALRDDPVPGLVPAATFRRFRLVGTAMSPGGKVVFRATVRRDVSPRRRAGIFIAE